MKKSAVKERARVVAWLRAQADCYRDRYRKISFAFPYSRNDFGMASLYADKFADLIERGYTTPDTDHDPRNFAELSSDSFL